jgi:hypothetical protein
MNRAWPLGFLLLASCAAPIEVTKIATASEAAEANGTKLHATTIIRGEARAPLPPDATISATKDVLEARVPRPGVFTYSLDPGETVVRDEQQRVVGVTSPSTGTTRFIAGTATLEGNEVRGELEGHVERLPLLPTDRVELKGTFAPGETVPTGGTVETTRATSALAFGSVLLSGAWLPSIIVAATSGIDANHWLYVPIAGPFIAYATRDDCVPQVDPRPCLNDAGERVALILDGIIQASGALLVVVGLPTSAEVRWGKQASVRLSPFSGSISGTF